MTSIDFPNMFSSVRTKTISDHEATSSNLRLLLGSHRGALLGDPYFGNKIKTFIHSQSNIILEDILIDDIYTAILAYMPQLVVSRNDISVKISEDDKYTLDVKISAVNKLDYTLNTYNVQLLGES